jgi:hypothetical protein
MIESLAPDFNASIFSSASEENVPMERHSDWRRKANAGSDCF